MIRYRRTCWTAKRASQGNALVEFALIAPVTTVLMLAIFDAGMYVYTFISVESAARAAAIRNSGGTESAADEATACSIAKDQLRGLPSVPSGGSCSSAPLKVSSVLCSGSSTCGAASTTADGQAATLVTVTYTLPSLFQLPFAGSTAVSISSQMRLRSNQ